MGCHVRTGGIARALARMGHRVRIFSLAGRRDDYRLFDPQRHTPQVVRIEPNLTEEIHLGLLTGLLQTIGRRLDYPASGNTRSRAGIFRGGSGSCCVKPTSLSATCPGAPGTRPLVQQAVVHDQPQSRPSAARAVEPASSAGRAWMRAVEARAPAATGISLPARKRTAISSASTIAPRWSCRSFVAESIRPPTR